MSFSKEIREKVYHKYNGHCAYCGKEIKYKDCKKNGKCSSCNAKPEKCEEE